MERGEIVDVPNTSLMRKCAWCYPETTAELREQIPLLPEGKTGYTDGICSYHLAILKAKRTVTLFFKEILYG